MCKERKVQKAIFNHMTLLKPVISYASMVKIMRSMQMWYAISMVILTLIRCRSVWTMWLCASEKERDMLWMRVVLHLHFIHVEIVRCMVFSMQQKTHTHTYSVSLPLSHFPYLIHINTKHCVPVVSSSIFEWNECFFFFQFFFLLLILTYNIHTHFDYFI